METKAPHTSAAKRIVACKSEPEGKRGGEEDLSAKSRRKVRSLSGCNPKVGKCRKRAAVEDTRYYSGKGQNQKLIMDRGASLGERDLGLTPVVAKRQKRKEFRPHKKNGGKREGNVGRIPRKTLTTKHNGLFRRRLFST